MIGVTSSTQCAEDIERLTAVARDDAERAAAGGFEPPLLIRPAMAGPLDRRRGGLGRGEGHVETFAAVARHDLDVPFRRHRRDTKTEDHAVSVGPAHWGRTIERSVIGLKQLIDRIGARAQLEVMQRDRSGRWDS